MPNTGRHQLSSELLAERLKWKHLCEATVTVVPEPVSRLSAVIRSFSFRYSSTSCKDRLPACLKPDTGLTAAQQLVLA